MPVIVAPKAGLTKGRIVRALTGVGVALTMLMSNMGAASAEKAGFTDPADTTGLDIRRVHVNYGDRLYMRVKHDGPLGYNESYRFWIDTRPANPGPEYYVSFAANTEFGPMKRVDGFTDPTKQSVTCSWRPHADAVTNSDVEVRIPGSCLGDPGKVRTSLRFVKASGSGDWAPGYRRFYDWVRRH